MPPLQSHPKDHLNKLHFLQHLTDELSQKLASTKLDALEYANILQVVLNAHSEIRRTTIEWNNHATNKEKKGV